VDCVEVPSVVVVVDYHLVVECLSRMINDRPEFDLLGTASDARSGLELIRCLRPDVALVDVRMGGSNDGLALAGAVTERGLGTRVILLCGCRDAAAIEAALAVGAGWVPKEAASCDIAQAIIETMAGRSAMAPILKSGLLLRGWPAASRSAPAAPELSRREAETLGLTSEGLGAKQIAWRLGVSEETVRTFLRRAYCKLGASNAAGAVAVAMRQGLLR
jgi:two-component system nitrate/nitrite response regulator NarL